jgi:hypothetical protein
LPFALDDLTEVIADGSARAEVMLGGELLIERGELIRRGHAHQERSGGGGTSGLMGLVEDVIIRA